MRMFITAAFIATAMSASAVNAAKIEMCQPRDNDARVLASPHANDIHTDWAGENYVGLSWGMVINGSQDNYLRGNLYSPRGGLINRNVWVLAKEWSCRVQTGVNFDAAGNLR